MKPILPMSPSLANGIAGSWEVEKGGRLNKGGRIQAFHQDNDLKDTENATQ